MSRKNRPENEKNNQPGSPPKGEPLYLMVGRLRKPHGMQGEILFEIHTDFPERIQVGRKLYLGTDYEPAVISSMRPHHKGLLVQFDEKKSIDEVDSFRNVWVFVKTEELPPLPEGEYYFHELVGLEVYNEHDEYLGILNEIFETGANDIYLILTPEGKEILLPAIEDVIKDVNILERKMIVSPPEWY